MLTINPKEIEVPKLHHYLLGAVGPRPIAFASTIDENGVANIAPYSFFNAFSSNPPTVVFVGLSAIQIDLKSKKSILQ